MGYIPTNTQILKYSLTGLLILWQLAQTHAQRMPPLSTQNKKAIKLYDEGMSALRQRQVAQAVELFGKAIKLDSAFAEAYFSVANAYTLSGEKDKAKPYWEWATFHGKGRSDFSPAYVNLGDICYQNGDYSCAMSNYAYYLTMRGIRQDLIPEIKMRLRNCEFAIKQMKNPVNIQPMKVPDSINVFQYQYFPTLTADNQRLYFTVKNDNTMEDIMVSKKVDEGWSMPRSVSNNINTPEANEGTCAISGDGRTLVLTACNKKDGVGRCDLYISYRQGQEWSAPQNLGEPINTPYWESQPTLSADGRLLVFVSDKPGGYGKRDLYFSRKSADGQWSAPKNMGPYINTAKEEVSPFIHTNDKSFYFASDGHLGMGGFDIYTVDFEDSIVKLPRNIGYPINTYKDELSLFITADASKAYYSIDEFKPGMRTGGRSFIFELLWPKELEIAGSKPLEGFVYDANTRKPIAASLELVNLSSDKIPLNFSSDSKDGSYTVVLTEKNTYGLFVQAEGYLYHSKNIDFKHSDIFNRNELDIFLEPVRKGNSLVMNNIFFDTDKAELRPESRAELERIIRLLGLNSQIKVEVSGHTDDVGADAYNLDLSKKRAKAVMDYLIKKGVATNRLTFQGYGKNKPRVPNSSDTNRQLNRRIEITVL